MRALLDTNVLLALPEGGLARCPSGDRYRHHTMPLGFRPDDDLAWREVGHEAQRSLEGEPVEGVLVPGRPAALAIPSGVAGLAQPAAARTKEGSPRI